MPFHDKLFKVGGMLFFTVLFLTFLLLSTGIHFYLDQRQMRSVLTHRGSVPERFASQVSLLSHQKAADYTLAKMKLGTWHAWYSLALLLAWTLGGGLDLLDTWISAWQLSGLNTGVLFLLAFAVISSVLMFPLTLYSIFSVEQRFGFNKMTLGLLFSDMLKQAALMLLIGAPLIWLVLWLMGSAGHTWWLWAWAVWTSFSILMMWAYPTFIAPMFNKFAPMEDGELKTAIENLLQRCGFESNGLFVMDGSKRSSHGNAYFTGFGKSKRIVFFDTLLKQLTTDETLAVLAHELGHFRCNHVKKRMLLMFSMSLAGFALMGWLSQQMWFYEGLGVSVPSNYMLLILFMLVMPVFTFPLSPLMSMYSRKHEFEADDYAKEHANAQDLISALVKMYDDNAATLTPDEMYSAWHDSHPPAPVRVAHLESKG
ncbi:MAG: M48 family metallopeptidase [Mariprofundaceae bacterium]|nr:M48 family metallopeptidase [Mariprofundaceae bacterium]